MEEYEVLESLGRGHQGNVQKVQKDGKIYALKIFQDVLDAEREIEILKTLSFPMCHPLLLCYIKAVDFGDSLGMVTEYIEGPTLADLFRYSGGVTDDQLVMLTKYIFEGLDYIHSKGIVHNDISAANFIFDRKRLKIIDFGRACFYTSEESIYKCEPEATTDNLFELETGEINLNSRLYPGLDIMATGIMLWKLKNPNVGSGKRHYFIGMTKNYETFIKKLSEATNRASYYILHAPRLLEELQREVDNYSLETNNEMLGKIIRKSALVDPYRRPSAADLVRDISK
jgi:serine/threonine protein kinase